MNYKTNKEAVYLLLMVALSYPVLSVCPENILFYSPIGNVYLGNDTILKLVNDLFSSPNAILKVSSSTFLFIVWLR